MYRQKKSRFWWIGWRANGKIFFRSTKQSERKLAEKELAKVQSLFLAHRAGMLEEVYGSLSGKVLPRVTLKGAIEDWLGEVKASADAGTFNRYAGISERLAEFLGAGPDGPLLREVTTEQLREYLTKRRASSSASTVNLERKILSVFFRRAIANQQLRENPVTPIRALKGMEEEGAKRRAFTVEELRLLFRKAPNPFWRFMICGGFYSGLRMGDLISLAWPQVDLAEGMLRVKMRKTGATVQIPIAEPLRAVLLELWNRGGKPRSGFVWPEQAAAYEAKGSGAFSNEFYDLLLAPCGFVRPREDKQKKAAGRASERRLNPISFHSFRHSFVSQLKATGGSQVVAKQLAGHSSDLISDNYTTLPPDVLAKAVNGLPMLEVGI